MSAIDGLMAVLDGWLGNVINVDAIPLGVESADAKQWSIASKKRA